MRSAQNEFRDDIDWNVFKKQQTIPESIKSKEMQRENVGIDQSRMDVPLGQNPNQPNMVNTFLGKMPDPRYSRPFDTNTPSFKKNIGELIDASAGGPGMKILGEGAAIAKPVIAKGIQKGWDYLHPEKEAEAFRSELGQGTSSENIADLSKRAQFAKNSAKEEALIPKNELYAQKGKSNVYDVDKSTLPEGNIPKMAEMIAPSENYGKSEAMALSKAIAKYRRTGNIDDFSDTAEDIFHIPELGEKAVGKIEDALSLPTKRGSSYFSDADVTMPYSKKGKIMSLHNQYETKPILNNYQDLRSAITTQMRKLKGRAKTDDVAAEKYEQMKLNLNNLDKDASGFIETLPKNMKDLDREFRQKYTKYAETYTKGEKETGASLTLRRLAEGRHDLVKDSDVMKLFSHPTASDKAAILDMGESAAKNALYSALQKVPLGDAEKMAKSILDLKRTKGFDKIVTQKMEDWAENMLNQTRRAGMIKKGLSMAGGAGIGGALAGPIGAAIGAAIPLGKEYGSAWGKILASKLKK